jgi:hypothetical protein
MSIFVKMFFNSLFNSLRLLQVILHWRSPYVLEDKKIFGLVLGVLLLILNTLYDTAQGL